MKHMNMKNISETESTQASQQTLLGTAQPAAVSQKDESDERGTPADLITALVNANNGLFEIDLASGAEPKRIGLVRLDKEDNALTSSWDPDDHAPSPDSIDMSVGKGSAWLNPPFSKGKKFAAKLDAEMQKGAIDYLIFLCSAQSISSDWYHDDVLPHAEHICIPDDRLEFTNTGGNPDMPCILTALGDVPAQFVTLFHDEGQCLDVIEQSNVQEQLSEFIDNSVHNTEESPGLISTEYQAGEPILNGVGRGDVLELILRDDMYGYSSIDTEGDVLRVKISTWTDTEGYWEIMTVLPASEGPFSFDAFFVIRVNKHKASAFDVAYQPGNGNHQWKPVAIQDIRTITRTIEWNNSTSSESKRK